MLTYARGQIVVEDMVGVDHCVARCVRRAFLCGVDPYTGEDHLAPIVERLGLKDEPFCVSRQLTTPIRWSS